MRVPSQLLIALFCTQSGAAADMPPIGRIVVFGDLHLESAVRELLPPVPVSLGDADGENLRKKLAASSSWRQSDMTWVCCESAGTAILYVGVRATDRRPQFRPTPTGAIRLDDEDLAIYDRLMELNHEAVTTGRSGPKDEARRIEDQVMARAGVRAARWREVALNSGDKRHRAAAIHLAPYGAKDQALADALAAASQDADALVRNNAVRAMSVLARSSRDSSHVRLDPTPLLNLFDSVHWTDWNKASFALEALTEASDPKLLAEIAARATGPLRQIANWPPMHSEPGSVILKRVGSEGLLNKPVPK
ncbi:MAG: hypothetical protein WD696_22115 [Bryobacteraceae bacterium]